MRLAYADPPYIGCAKRHYGDHPDYQEEVDHVALVCRLRDEFSDGWVLSLHTPSLRDLLNICYDAGVTNVRVGAWVKPWCVWYDKNVAYAWEPVLWCGGRKRNWRTRDTALDWVSANAVMNRKSDPNHTHGTKPVDFCYWVFDLLGAERGDDLVDMFPGSGAVMSAWKDWNMRHMRELDI